MKRGYLLAAGASLFFSLAGMGGTANATEEYCREYTKTIYIGGKAQEGYGSACMKPDGSWEFVNESNEIIPNQPMALPMQRRNVSTVIYYNDLDYYLRPFGWYPGRHIERRIERRHYYVDHHPHRYHYNDYGYRGNPHRNNYPRYYSHPYAWR